MAQRQSCKCLFKPCPGRKLTWENVLAWGCKKPDPFAYYLCFKLAQPNWFNSIGFVILSRFCWFSYRCPYYIPWTYEFILTVMSQSYCKSVFSKLWPSFTERELIGSYVFPGMRHLPFLPYTWNIVDQGQS